jgi:hypothetical protein
MMVRRCVKGPPHVTSVRRGGLVVNEQRRRQVCFGSDLWWGEVVIPCASITSMA